MRKTNALWLFVLILLFSCKKDAKNSNETDVSQSTSFQKAVADAKLFFQTVEAKGSAPGVQRAAQWDKAYIGKLNSGNLIVVPLKYSNHNGFTTSFNNTELSMEKQSHLCITQNLDGKYQAEVVTVLPEKDYANSPNEKFSGVIVIDDWQGNNINTFIYKDGKKYKYVPSNSANKTNEVTCTVINWYTCQMDEYGNTYNCVFDGYTVLGCWDNMSLQPVGDGGMSGGSGSGNVTIEYINDITYTVVKMWWVKETIFGSMVSNETVTGIRNFATSSSDHNHFIDIVPASSYLRDVQNDSPPFPATPHPILYDYVQDSHACSKSGTPYLFVNATVAGHWTLQPINGNGVPNGSPGTQTGDGSTGWSFPQVFP
jgi:hypothetical protein